ncbi:MAG: hypothetical protein KF680_00655 [Cryobacterium sp.]|nr:hypothetical protein [Cryobacterium sp.]
MRWSFAPTAALLVLGIAGCTGVPMTPALTTLPEGVSVDVYQTRLDYSERQLEISITNESQTDVVITHLEFASPAFVSAVSYGRLPTTIAAGRTIDFRVDLAAPDCTANDPTPTVTIEFDQHGQAGTANVEPVDRLGQLPRIMTADCLASDAAQIARIGFADVPLGRTSFAGRDVAELYLEVEPTGAAGSITLHAIEDTVLLFVLDPATGTAIESIPLDLEIDATSEKRTVTVTLVPSRCDQHSVAEDKRGTFFPVTVTTPRREGTLFIATGERLRGEIFDFLADSCGWG